MDYLVGPTYWKRQRTEARRSKYETIAVIVTMLLAALAIACEFSGATSSLIELF